MVAKQNPTRVADDLRRRIEQAGGLASLSDLAHGWGMSKQRVAVLSKRDGFPEPVVVIGNRPLWLRAEADAWRAGHDHG